MKFTAREAIETNDSHAAPSGRERAAPTTASTALWTGPHTPASLAREPGSTRLEMDQIRQCMDNKEPSRVKFRRAEPDPPLLAVRLGSARLEYQFASVWRITDRTRAPTTEKSVHSFFTTVRQTLRTTRSAKVLRGRRSRVRIQEVCSPTKEWIFPVNPRLGRVRRPRDLWARRRGTTKPGDNVLPLATCCCPPYPQPTRDGLHAIHTLPRRCAIPNLAEL
ncbi:hypothetical protein J6590_015439 [Homalodisca vitripennis]|nr:hypothetical protein J6590_015439 [Homalodisca vitripennis]